MGLSWVRSDICQLSQTHGACCDNDPRGAGVPGGVLLASRDYGLWSSAPAGPGPVDDDRRCGGAAAILGGVVAVPSGGEVVYAAPFPAEFVGSTAWATLGMSWWWELGERLEARRLSAGVSGFVPKTFGTWRRDGRVLPAIGTDASISEIAE